MSEQTALDQIDSAAGQIISQLFDVVLSNYNIWIPVIFAWTAGFMATRYLNLVNIRRKAEREWFVYKTNGFVAFVSYLLFNWQTGFDALQQATLAASVAVLVPVCWFWWRRVK